MLLQDTPDGRALVAIGCSEGVWIGFRHDPNCMLGNKRLTDGSLLPYSLAMRRVLLLKMVTQCAMLEEFGIFLVLADKVCPLSNLMMRISFLLSLATVRIPY